MKKIIGIFVSGIIAMTAVSCVEESFVQYSPEDAQAPVLEAVSAEAYTLTSGGSFETFNFSPASFGMPVAVRYTLYCDVEGNEFQNEKSIASVDSPNSSLTVSANDLNAALIRLNCSPNLETSVEFRLKALWMGESVAVQSTDGSNYELCSNVISAKVVPFEAPRELPMLYVIGSYNSWNHSTCLNLYSFTEDEINYSGVIDFGESHAANEFKFTDAPDWNHGDWGTSATDEAQSIALVAKGSNIACFTTYRYYSFSANLSDLTLKVNASFDSMTLTGLGEDVEMSFYSGTQRFYADVTLDASSSFQFSAGGVTYGGAIDAVVVGGAGITPGLSGNYRVYFDMNDWSSMTVVLSADAYGTEEGADDEPAPDPTWQMNSSAFSWTAQDMTATGNKFAYSLTGIEVAAEDQFGFLDPNGTWYGVVTADYEGAAYAPTGTAFNISLTSGAYTNGLVQTAGTYDFWVVPSRNVAYMMPEGQIPEKVDESYGVVGTINGWGDIGDFAMTLDDSGYYVARNIVISTDDQFKVRYNNDWASNWGTAGTLTAGTSVAVTAGGDNLAVATAGTYDVWFDLTGLKICVTEAGSAAPTM